MTAPCSSRPSPASPGATRLARLPVRRRTRSQRSAPPAVRTFRGRAPPRPRLLSGPPTRARAHPPPRTHPPGVKDRASERGSRAANPPLLPGPNGAANQRRAWEGRGFVAEDPPPSVPASPPRLVGSQKRVGFACQAL